MKRVQGSSNSVDSHLADGQAVIFPIQLTCVTFNFFAIALQLKRLGKCSGGVLSDAVLVYC